MNGRICLSNLQMIPRSDRERSEEREISLDSQSQEDECVCGSSKLDTRKALKRLTAKDSRGGLNVEHKTNSIRHEIISSSSEIT